MDPEITALAQTAGSTLVALMATDTWQRARDGVSGLWRRVHPDRAAAIEANLDESRAELTAADGAGDATVASELAGEWQGRIRRLVQSDPSVIEELRTLVAELQALVPADTTPRAGNISLRAEATGHGRVYQAGRDQHITER